MMEAIFIISPLIGSIIGYFTNWLAIKMLFRPLTEKRIFGIKIPLTPGVIPSRRDKLAESIGKAVGDVILTPEAFKRVIDDKRIHKKLNQYLAKKIETLQQDNRSVKEILAKFLGYNIEVDKLQEQIEDISYQILKKLIDDGSLIDLLFNSEVISQKNFEKLFNSRKYQEFKDKTISYLTSNLEAETIEKLVYKILTSTINEYNDSQQKLKTIIPIDLQQSGEEFLLKLTPLLQQEITTFLESTRAREIVANEIENVMENNTLLKMAGNFISQDKIVDLIINYLLELFQQEKGGEMIEEQINNFYQRVLLLNLGDVLAEINQVKIKQIAEFIAQEVSENKTVKKILLALEKSFSRYLLESNDFAEKINTYLKEVLVENKLTVELIQFFLKTLLNKLLNKAVKNYAVLLTNAELEKLKDFILLIFDALVEYYFYDVVAAFDFENLVVERINTFDILEVENLLLKVIETELDAITWFGAFLGFWLGLITPILNLFL